MNLPNSIISERKVVINISNKLADEVTRPMQIFFFFFFYLVDIFLIPYRFVKRLLTEIPMQK